ncbi:MAG: ATP-binding protein [Bacteroidota bacterium]
MNPNTKKYSVFIVDDDPLIRKSLEIKLKQEDHYELSSFSSGEACLAALDENPDLILMDYNMGNEAMNGMEAMLKIKEVSPSTDVAILSAQDEIPVAIEILNRGAIQYLSKEHVLDFGIERSVEEIFEKKKLRDEIERKNEEILRKNCELELAQKEILRANEELTQINANLDKLVKRRTDALINSLNKLKESKEELENFVYRASHDLKGPTARLLGLIQVSQMLPDDPSNLGYMEEVIKGLDKIVENFIYVHTLHKNPIAFKEVQLEELLEEIFTQIRDIPKSEGIDLNYKINGSKTVYMDVLLLQIILSNILENSIYFHKPEDTQGRSVYVEISNFEENLKIIVEDNGPGIDVSIRGKIFEMFFRGAHDSHGNGLGLYLVDKAVRKLEGSIRLESESGKFSRFNIELPLSKK